MTTIGGVKRVETRIDEIEVTLAWGNPDEIKGALRSESEQRFRSLPPAERLLIALSMVQPARPGEQRER
ncbi:MAG: hypothetical protein HYZ28_09575 [Myxococcales bacterium]|nr:hypothetical protein [Myxococcales bacterium]